MESSTKRRANFILVLIMAALGAAGCGREEPVTAAPAAPAAPDDLEGLVAALETAAASVRLADDSVEIGQGYSGARLEIGPESLLVFEVPSGPPREQLGQFLLTKEPGTIIWRTEQLLIAYAGQDGGVVLVVSGLVGDPVGGAAPAQDEPFPPAHPEFTRPRSG